MRTTLGWGFPYGDGDGVLGMLALIRLTRVTSNTDHTGPGNVQGLGSWLDLVDRSILVGVGEICHHLERNNLNS